MALHCYRESLYLAVGSGSWARFSPLEEVERDRIHLFLADANSPAFPRTNDGGVFLLFMFPMRLSAFPA